jgi:hypothetical protein
MFSEFDPLTAKQSNPSDITIRALKLEIQNILDSYVGWYDPFCELIQNALDSIEQKSSESDTDYTPQLWITINLKENLLIVSDNGVGLTKAQFEQFLAPCFSFKSGQTRGHKGVGATYLGYGFNYIQICTKTSDFSGIGKMLNARKWLSDPSPAGNPKVVKDTSGALGTEFNDIATGVSVAVKFDRSTRPGELSWLQATTAEQWRKILYIKTGLGSLVYHSQVAILIRVVDKDGNETISHSKQTEYFWPHLIVTKAHKLSQVRDKESELFTKQGANFRMPSTFTNLDCLFETIKSSELRNFIELDLIENKILTDHKPTIYFAYMYSAKVWSQFNEALGIRIGQSVLLPGIQIAANNMPQGEIVQIPLKRNIGRQNQIHVVIHLENCRADLGRKGFQNEIIEFACSVSKKLIEGPISKLRKYLRPVTGTQADLYREQQVDEWKEEFKKHEEANPLIIKNPNFFLPMKRVSITSKPTREQDVIALFNQLLAGGVIRGVQIMSTNERFTYDSMYRIIFDKPNQNHIYDPHTNPLGVLPDHIQDDFRSGPKILEYKFSFNGLIEDLEAGTKNSNDIGLVVTWETGIDYQGNYHITSLLDPDNLSERQYHGVTHVVTNLNSNQREMDLVVLEELVDFLNDPEKTIRDQKHKYDSL